MALHALQTLRATDRRFPHDFMFQLTAEGKAQVIAIRDNPERLKFSPSFPCAFTEHEDVSPSLRIVAVRDDFLDARGDSVAQVSKLVVADFQVGNTMEFGRPADLEIHDTADLEICATLVAAARRYDVCCLI